MVQPPVPKADELRRIALAGDIDTILSFLGSEVTVLHALINAGQAVNSLNDQCDRLTKPHDTTDAKIIEARTLAIALLDACAESAHMVLKQIVEKEARREAAKYN
jgi:hypothetical protein